MIYIYIYIYIILVTSWWIYHLTQNGNQGGAGGAKPPTKSNRQTGTKTNHNRHKSMRGKGPKLTQKLQKTLTPLGHPGP